MTQFLVDSHAHLDDPQFDADREAVIARAAAANVRCILTVGGGTGADNLDAPVSLAEHYDGVLAAVGIHPHDAQYCTDDHLGRLRRLAAHAKVVAIGEIGLDYYRDYSPRDIQRRVLIEQLELARASKHPVVIHCRQAWSDLREVLERHWWASGRGGILHCFSGSKEDAFAFLDMGFLVSFAGNITYPKADQLRSVARAIPLDRLLAETDCPYLAPVPHRGRRNEPAYVEKVVQTLAGLRGLQEEELERQLANNFRSLLLRAGGGVGPIERQIPPAGVAIK